ncbi:MAG: hypothetical protein H6565_05785 [Lewinellaceae bacterium]|nr:hypothetical protein [Saprospiraceae bacterium]MCB0543779.1 hypothetical protein [Saprospiraceae bacterium]MCB9306086.1 hypothetical protein [Lewinellaceae bacterium]MCB9356222.1 hypothetical protein [Lewinellaceae bacterium]
MKRFFLTILAAAAFLSTAQSQTVAERLKAIRAEVYTRVLNLTPEEAQNFWPIFNEYVDEKESLQKQLRPEGQIDGMSDAEVEDYIKKYFEVRQKEFDLEKELVQKLRKVLPARKIAKLPKAEREFRESLLKRLQELKERRQQRRGRN